MVCRSFGQRLGHDLERDVAIEAAVGGAVDLAHAAFAELLDDGVAADSLADHRAGIVQREMSTKRQSEEVQSAQLLDRAGVARLELPTEPLEWRIRLDRDPLARRRVS